MWRFIVFFLHSHSHLSLFHFCFELHFLPLNFYLHLHEVCFMNFFIYTFDHSEYFQIYIFRFIGSTYSANWILKRITTSIKPIKTNHQWTVFCDASLNVSDQSSYWSEQVRLLCFWICFLLLFRFWILLWILFRILLNLFKKSSYLLFQYFKIIIIFSLETSNI